MNTMRLRGTKAAIGTIVVLSRASCSSTRSSTFWEFNDAVISMGSVPRSLRGLELTGFDDQAQQL